MQHHGIPEENREMNGIYIYSLKQNIINKSNKKIRKKRNNNNKRNLKQNRAKNEYHYRSKERRKEAPHHSS